MGIQHAISPRKLAVKAIMDKIDPAKAFIDIEWDEMTYEVYRLNKHVHSAWKMSSIVWATLIVAALGFIWGIVFLVIWTNGELDTKNGKVSTWLSLGIAYWLFSILLVVA